MTNSVNECAEQTIGSVKMEVTSGTVQTEQKLYSSTCPVYAQS